MFKDKKIEYNPRNRRKKNYQFFLRKIEDLLRNFFILFLILILSFFNFYKIFKRKKILLKDFYDSNGMIFFINSLSKNYLFFIHTKDAVKIYRRLGFKLYFNNCVLNFFSFFLKKYTLSYNKNNEPDIFLNLDYFFPFEDNHQLKKNTLIAPYYFQKKFYLMSLDQKFRKLRNSQKKYKIIFSGSYHSEWYEQIPFFYDRKKELKIINRIEIVNTILSNFENYTTVIKNKSDLNKITESTQIILILSDPSLSRKKSKILSIDEHMRIISQSNFFVCMPGVNVPISHHMIECMLVGTVPITSSHKYFYPELNNKNSIGFFSQKDLIESIRTAVEMNNEHYEVLQKNIISYYDQHISTESFLSKFNNSDLPSEIFLNVDGGTYDAREIRYGFEKKFE